MVGTERIKDNMVETKEKIREITDKKDESGTDYAINKTNKAIRDTPYEIKRMNKYGKRAVKQTKENIQKASSKIKKKISQKSIKTAKKSAKKGIKGTTKTTKRTIKSVKKTGKVTYKTTKTAVKATVKATKRAIQIAKATAKATIVAVKTAIKLTILAIKAIISATEALIAAIVAGGWVAVIIIIVVCLIGLLCSSIYGIFFSSEDTGSHVEVNGEQQLITMNNVVSDLNIEFMNKITQIQRDNTYDEYDIEGKRAEWKDVLAVYATKISSGKNQADVITLDENKISMLKNIFWEMNEITYTTETIKEKMDKKLKI